MSNEKIKEQARRDGMAYMLKIAKQAEKDGKNVMQAMEDEIKLRGTTHVSIAVDTKVLNECINKIKDQTIDTVKILSTYTNIKYMHYGERQCNKFNTGFDIETERMCGGLATWADLQEDIKRETGIKLFIRENK